MTVLPTKPFNVQSAADIFLSAERLRAHCQEQALTATHLCAALVREQLGEIAPGEGADIVRIEQAMIARSQAGLDPITALDVVATSGRLDYPWSLGRGLARPPLRAACAHLQHEFNLARKRETCVKEGLIITTGLPLPVARKVRPLAL